MTPAISKAFKTHVEIEESQYETMCLLKPDFGSKSAQIRAALHDWLATKIQESSDRAADRRRQTLQALQLQEQRAQTDALESAYKTRSQDFKNW